jgi:hypothetical protein
MYIFIIFVLQPFPQGFASMIPVDLDSESDSQADVSAAVEKDTSSSHHVPSVLSASEEALHELLICGRPPPDLARGDGVSATSSGSAVAAAVESQPAFGERHVSREDIGCITFVVGLSEDTVGFLIRAPWHSIVVGVSRHSTEWIATHCDRAPFLIGRMPTELPLAMDIRLPVFAARSSFVDCLRYKRHLVVLDWSLLVVEADFAQATCGRESLVCAALQSHRLARCAPDAPGVWKRVASTLVETHSRVVSCMLEPGLDVEKVASMLLPHIDALGVACQLVSQNSNGSWGIFVLGRRNEIKGIDFKLSFSGLGRVPNPLPWAFDQYLPKAVCKGVAGGTFLGLWFQYVSRRTAPAVAARAVSAECRALKAVGKAAQKRSRPVDDSDL